MSSKQWKDGVKMKDIEFRHVTKRYGRTTVVNDMNLTIHEGERLILLGPSGCGKSTTLRMIAGLEGITEGDLLMGGQRMNEVPCGRRGVSMVFQNYAIYPHMTVKENIVYGLKAHHMPAADLEERLKDVLQMLQLTEYAERKPKDLSGGQRQRVALARAIVKRSDYFLLDEPLSNLDAQLRVHARKELVRIHEKYHQTFVYVTHDQVEAMTVGQRIALMHDGRMAMVDTPERVYQHPADVFCAKFIGSPAMNIFPITVSGEVLTVGASKLALPERLSALAATHPGEGYLAGIRPEDLRLCWEGDGAEAVGGNDAAAAFGRGAIREDSHALITGTAHYIEDYGNRVGVYFQPDGCEDEIVAICPAGMAPQPGTRVFALPRFDRFHLFDKETQKNLGV